MTFITFSKVSSFDSGSHSSTLHRRILNLLFSLSFSVSSFNAVCLKIELGFAVSETVSGLLIGHRMRKYAVVQTAHLPVA